MKAPRLALALSMVWASSAVAADHGHSSGGSSSGGGHSAVHSSSSSGGSGAAVRDAERAHPRPGTGTGFRGGRGFYPGYSFGFYASPYYYSPFYGYYGYPYSDFYGGYYGGYAGYGGSYARADYPYSYRHYRDTGALRIMVDPDQTRVYVDGYYAGIVDDFDGVFQRLYVAPGRHEIMLKLDGFQTHRFHLYVTPDQTLKLHYKMVKGTGEDAAEDLGGGPPPARDDRDERTDPDRGYGRDRTPDGDPRDGRPRIEMRDDRARHDPGRVRLDIRPADASVYVDGEFLGTTGRNRTVELGPGRHRLEVVRPGFRTAERDVEVRAGETVDLTVELDRP